MTGTRRNNDSFATGNGRHQICERFANASTGFTDQDVRLVNAPINLSCQLLLLQSRAKPGLTLHKGPAIAEQFSRGGANNIIDRLVQGI